MFARIFFRSPSVAGLMGVLAVTAGLSGCESPHEPPPPPPMAIAPPAPPVLLPRSVVQLASVYEEYVQHAAAIDPGFTGGAGVAESLKTGETYEAGQFQRGQAAYGAIVALQEPTFVAGLREFARDPERRSEIANRLVADPNYAASLKGADAAAGLVIAAFTEHGRKLLATGARIHQAAYDVQHQSWSRSDVQDRPGRLALAKALSAQQQDAIEVDTIRLAGAAAGREPMGMVGGPVSPPYTPLVARALAVAAMAALGEGGEEYSSPLTTLLSESSESQCLHMAKLNLYQCLAVAKPHYEDVFCLGQHAVAETGQCVMKSAVVDYVLAPPAPQAAPKVEKASSKKPIRRRKRAASDAG